MRLETSHPKNQLRPSAPDHSRDCGPNKLHELARRAIERASLAASIHMIVEDESPATQPAEPSS